MDLKRIALIAGLAAVTYLMLLAWNEDYPSQPEPQDLGPAADPVSAPDDSMAAADESLDLPAVPAAAEAVADDSPPSSEVADANPAASSPETDYIRITTPKQVVSIAPLGGDIVEVFLRDFPVSLDAPEEPFRLLRDDSRLVYIAQSGLIGRDGPDASAGGRPLFRSERSSYALNEGDAELAVDLRFADEAGAEITKRFIFSADDYLIRVQYLIDNRSANPWQANLYGQIKRDGSPDPSSAGGFFSLRTFLGAALTTQDDPYKKYNFGDIGDGIEPIEIQGGWIAFSQHYFLGSWIPNPDTVNVFTTRRNARDNTYLLTFVSPAFSVAPNQRQSVEAGFWAGPKDQYRLEEIAPNLGLTIDYGWFFFIASPIFWLLTQINNFVGNYGWSIVLLTVVIKTLLYWLSAASYRSNARMRMLTPKINELKDRYGDDKQKFMQAQMDLWKKEKVNPLGGCLPMLVQMPIFLGIFWVLNESVELRQASFILWYKDLSKMDPYFVLPLLMGATMYVQQQLTPIQTADPAQTKVLKFMPLIFTVFFLWFPAGLVLYYTVNSLLSILQQWFVTRQVEKAHQARAG